MPHTGEKDLKKIIRRGRNKNNKTNIRRSVFFSVAAADRFGS